MVDLIQKTKEDYDAIAEAFAGTRYDAGSDLIEFKPFIKAGQRILDWGCGNGRLLYLLDQTLTHIAPTLTGKDRLDYCGVDQSEALLKIAEWTHQKLIEGGQVQFFSTATDEKKFPEASFDLAFSIASFHHLPDSLSRFGLLKQIHSELAPGGKLLLSVWNLDSDWANKQKSKWTELNSRDYLIPWKDADGEVLADRYYHAFDFAELTELLESAGFTIEKMWYATEGKEVDARKGKNIVVIAHKK